MTGCGNCYPSLGSTVHWARNRKSESRQVYWSNCPATISVYWKVRWVFLLHIAQMMNPKMHRAGICNLLRRMGFRASVASQYLYHLITGGGRCWYVLRLLLWVAGPVHVEAVLRMYGRHHHECGVESSWFWRCNFTFPRSFQFVQGINLCHRLLSFPVFTLAFLAPNSTVAPFAECECCGMSHGIEIYVYGLFGVVKLCDVAFYVVASRIHDF
jgi:hypothetical protein